MIPAGLLKINDITSVDIFTNRTQFNTFSTCSNQLLDSAWCYAISEFTD